LDCLAYFYPRMSQGGIIVCHDYIAFSGVRKAADEFFQEKPEAVIELPGNQCLIVKL
jgi:O-methyltransferase